MSRPPVKRFLKKNPHPPIKKNPTPASPPPNPTHSTPTYPITNTLPHCPNPPHVSNYQYAKPLHTTKPQPHPIAYPTTNMAPHSEGRIARNPPTSNKAKARMLSHTRAG